MILTETVIQMILTNGLSLKLASELGFKQQWILISAKKNKKNGPLTTAKAIQVIREYAGLLDSEILVEEIKEPAKNS
jgi:hypothetical protein